jgi:hypothetical protein
MSAIWTVQNISSVPSFEGKENVVATITVLASDVSSYGQVVGIDYSNVGNNPNFKPWDQLSKEEVLSWAKAALGVERVAKIEQDITQPTLQPQPQSTLPWNN